MDQSDVLLADAENKVILTVGEEPLNDVDGHGLGLVVDRTDNEHAARHLGRDVQILRAHVDVADEDVV